MTTEAVGLGDLAQIVRKGQDAKTLTVEGGRRMRGSREDLRHA